ncbi:MULTISPECIES: hypothetical protein [Xenorhabdus]|uniref:hypothetical protein n=1 Tax=Xenorhabdus TaxID=626 RepID=UPI000647EEDF|nr:MULTISPECIES: hypothetical protein [Xenorhabdus]
MSNKTPGIELFMTSTDEEQFSIALKNKIDSIKFIEQYVWDDNTLPISDILKFGETIDKSNFSIINTKILSVEMYKNQYITPHPSGMGYIGGWVGKGLIQFLRSKTANYATNCLRNGTLSASYDPIQDPETDLFVKTVWKIFKKGAQKVYLIDRETGKVANKSETKFFAWPDAAEKYNGKNENYLTNNAFSYFIAKK